MRNGLRIVFVAAVALAGCAALIDVKDIHLGDDSDGGPDGSNDGQVSPDGPRDAGGDGAIACNADKTSDPKNCGRCGHDCVGGTCTAGKCDALELAAVADAPFHFLVETGMQVFVSTQITLITQVGGIWRVQKAGGLPEKYVTTLPSAQAMAVVGDTLYFVVTDDPSDDAGKTGGFYSCPVNGSAPCNPTRIATADNPYALTVDKGILFYGDQAVGKGIMRYAPGTAAPTVFRAGYSPEYIYVDDPAVYYTVSFFQNPSAKLIQIFPDGGFVAESEYTGPNANSGRVIGSPTAVTFATYDYSGTTGGVVRRWPRVAGGLPCDYGAASNKRPYGLYADATQLYWTNQGEGADLPYTAGSVATCESSGCCATPTILWTGDGQPTGITGDADAIYFVTKAKGSLVKLAKP